MEHNRKKEIQLEADEKQHLKRYRDKPAMRERKIKIILIEMRQGETWNIYKIGSHSAHGVCTSENKANQLNLTFLHNFKYMSKSLPTWAVD